MATRRERLVTWRLGRFEQNAAKFARHPWRDGLMSAGVVAVVTFAGSLSSGVLSAAIGAVVFGVLWALAYRFLARPWWTRRASRTTAVQ